MCLPYNDWMLITAQVLSAILLPAVAFLSLMYGITYYDSTVAQEVIIRATAASFYMGIAAFLGLQVIWCFRPHRVGLLFLGALSLGSVVTWIIVSVYSKIFLGYCLAGVWFIVSALIFLFVASGRLRRFEAKYENNEMPGAVMDVVLGTDEAIPVAASAVVVTEAIVLPPDPKETA